MIWMSNTLLSLYSHNPKQSLFIDQEIISFGYNLTNSTSSLPCSRASVWHLLYFIVLFFCLSEYFWFLRCIRYSQTHHSQPFTYKTCCYLLTQNNLVEPQVGPKQTLFLSSQWRPEVLDVCRPTWRLKHGSKLSIK